jgi:hypothetical protein
MKTMELSTIFQLREQKYPGESEGKYEFATLYNLFPF